MGKKIFVLLLLAAVSLAIPAAALSAVVFEPAEARFITGVPFGEQPAASVNVSLSDGAPVRAIRFEDGSTLRDVGADFGFDTGLLVSADVTETGGAGAAKLTFSGEVPGVIGFRRYPVRVLLFSDAEPSEESFIASADFTAEVAARYGMEYDELPPITAGEPLDERVIFSFTDNLTGEEPVNLPLKSLIVAPPLTETYKDLGLTFTPDPASSTIRITSDAPLAGEEDYRILAETDGGTIEESYIRVRVEEHTLTFSTPFLLAEATEEFDCYVTLDKRPASAPLTGFNTVMILSDSAYDAGDEDDVPAFEAMVSRTGSLAWNGLTIDLEADAPRLRIHGTAVEQWQGRLYLEGYLPNETEPRLSSVPLEIVTHQFENGNLLDVENATVIRPDGSSNWGMDLDGENTLTLPMTIDPYGDDGAPDIAVSVRDPSGVITRIARQEMNIDEDGNATFEISYIPQEPGAYVFEFLYEIDDRQYYELARLETNEPPSSSGGGCNAAMFPPLALAVLAALCFRRR